VLTFENLTYSKNHKKIFENLGYTVSLNSCLLLTGKNGSGKTSLLKIIAGIIKADSGKILWNNQDVSKFYTEFSNDIQYIGHKNFLKPKLTVLENLSFYSRLKDSEMLIPSAIRYFGLEEIIDTEIYKLSQGWQKKVLLSKLLCCPSAIWLLDEPTTNLDKQGKELLFNLIGGRIRDGGMVIAATHEDMLLALGNKLCLEDFNYSS
jgi:heme exporter protein A